MREGLDSPLTQGNSPSGALLSTCLREVRVTQTGLELESAGPGLASVPAAPQCASSPAPGNLPDQEVERLRLSPCKQRSRACWMRGPPCMSWPLLHPESSPAWGTDAGQSGDPQAQAWPSRAASGERALQPCAVSRLPPGLDRPWQCCSERQDRALRPP